MKKRNIWAWTIGGVGLLGVIIPHVSFMAGLISSLSSISHATLQLISASFVFIGFLLKN